MTRNEDPRSNSAPAVPRPPEAGAAAAPQIADRSYRGYDGELRTRANRWWIVALATVRGSVRKPAFWILAGLIALGYIGNGLFLYFARDTVEQLGRADVLGKAIYADTLFRSLSFSRLPLFLLALVVGAGSIAADNRANALLVYLSKPITKADYLLGKWAGVFGLLGAASLAPALLLYLFFVAAYSGEGFLRQDPWLVVRLVGATLLPALLHASLILGFSAWSKSPRLAGAAYAGLYFVVGIVTGIAGGILLGNLPRNGAADGRPVALVRSLSVDGVIAGVGMHLYDVTPSPPGQNRRRGRQQSPPPEPPAFAPERPPLAPLLALGGAFVVLPLLAARARIRAVEVVTG